MVGVASFEAGVVKGVVEELRESFHLIFLVSIDEVVVITL